MATGLFALGTALTVGSIYQQGKARKQQQRQLEFQRQQAELTQARRRREQIRSARIATANAQVTAAGQGVSDSSGAQGGVSSILSQLGSNLGFNIQMDLISDQIATSQGKELNALTRSQYFSGAADLAFAGSNFLASQGKAAAGGG